MPRRYGPDGTALWNGKAPEEFSEADVYRFMAETEEVLQSGSCWAVKATPGRLPSGWPRAHTGRPGQRRPPRQGSGEGVRA